MRPITKIIIFIAAVAVLFFLFSYSAQILLAPSSIENLKNKVCFGQNCFFVKIAETEQEREKGLMFQSQLDKNAGMLFIFEKEGNYPFWMKNTLISLDIIWINKDKKVVFIEKSAQPCHGPNCPITNSGVNAQYVLEVNAGISDEFDIKVGDVVQIGG